MERFTLEKIAELLGDSRTALNSVSTLEKGANNGN